jgi:hypothetical protein
VLKVIQGHRVMEEELVTKELKAKQVIQVLKEPPVTQVLKELQVR